ncbi:hypothetical protein SEA_RENNA12_61 [Arthrobacter phage Renna12]|nr:hypothetical protein SEA_RENNA12_61 [Arthrobacter phage Renna12]
MDEALRHHAAASRGYAGMVADSRKPEAMGPEFAETLAGVGRVFLAALGSIVGAADSAQEDYALAGPAEAAES